jgi:hypothetical protein
LVPAAAVPVLRPAEGGTTGGTCVCTMIMNIVEDDVMKKPFDAIKY